MISFGMKTTLVCFQDKYYSYKEVMKENGRIEDEDNNGLAIGAFKAAFCVGMGATYVYEMYEEIIEKLKYAGTYHGNGLTIFQNQRSIHETISWLYNFQLQ
eukprot:9993053-Ditylum_brightwellii.AAC.1